MSKLEEICDDDAQICVFKLTYEFVAPSVNSTRYQKYAYVDSDTVLFGGLLIGCEKDLLKHL